MQSNEENKTLNLYPIDYPFETLVSRINSNPPKTILDPDFQRKYKWDKDGWGRSSKFIESCLMRIPLPSCYFAEDSKRRHLVIDGVQRLTTIKKFFNDEFSLEGMTIFKDLEGKKFSELGDYQADLESTTIRCIVLRKENPKELIREIFSRLNQGAVTLSDQEIRHALYPGELDDLLTELGNVEIIKYFGLPKKNPKNKKNREPDEQILRFFAFSDDLTLKNHNNNLKEFLNKYMQENYLISRKDANKLKNKFHSALRKCITVFGDDVFTDHTKERRRQGLFHYDLLMPTLDLLENTLINKKSKKIKKAYGKLCNNSQFKRSLSGGLQKKNSILTRRKLWDEYLKEAIDA